MYLLSDKAEYNLARDE